MATRKPRTDPEQAAIEAALKLAAERGWRALGLADIAEAAGLSLAELHPRLGSKQALLDAFARRVDAEVLAEAAPDAGESARDRLFDVLMRRFDALQPHRLALGNILQDQLRAPGEALCSLAQLGRSMAWMLAAAGIPSEGLAGLLRVKGLAAIYLATLRVFLRDDSADLSKTMAALDGYLRRVEWLAGRLQRRRGRRSGAESDPASDPATGPSKA
ncbi:transcriptional regulator, TetR family [Tistlia consotensis]|uniref:Transcriptional regulator, TetR family n=1 Tax=Tistlia consotensis USBA 355 TaxID=560819 RepID=A0A1Y6C560_9PROT|nr:TetR/AcrR family transcriptional regulator [Tistlia consotensis]SMF46122.1 transcriptional regulator, TetR family [Tistlia consotensis USBA 355]SNR78897.1 transcriptional regulator, TetR family [Tistlia consotensis]